MRKGAKLLNLVLTDSTIQRTTNLLRRILMKRTIPVFRAIVLLAAMVAAVVFASSGTAVSAADKPCKIGFSVYDMQYGFFQAMEKGTHEAATAAKCDYVLVDQKSSESTMVSATQDLLNQDITALIISPIKPDAMGPILDPAKANGIPVVVHHICTGSTQYQTL